MPTTIYHRLWCKTCKGWTLHSKGFKPDATNDCRDCGTTHESTLLGDIPKEKLIEQRERYKEMNRNQMDSLLFGMPFGLGTSVMMDMFFSEPGSDIKIIESDAGQKVIDKAEKKRRDEIYEQRKKERQQQQEEAKKYKHLGRNDPCACGSGLKFKKCCLSKIQSY